MISRCTRTDGLSLVAHPCHKGTTHLLAKANPRSRVKREEDEWVWNKVLFNPLIQETVGVEFQGCPVDKVSG